jgi:uncharacterized protein YqgV (UPF0045/DUF77 family)
MVLAQLSVYPIGEGTSLSKYVKKGIQVIRDSVFKYEIGGLSTAPCYLTRPESFNIKLSGR